MIGEEVLLEFKNQAERLLIKKAELDWIDNKVG